MLLTEAPAPRQPTRNWNELAAEVDRLRRSDPVAAIERAEAWLAAERAAAADGLDGALVSLYERLRDQHGGIGAARLLRGQCQGCQLSLNAGDLAAIVSAAPDQVVRCEECGRILVREDGA